MKKKLLWALWACLALITTNVTAQKDDEKIIFNDTLQIIPNENIKVLLIGNNLTQLVSYSKIDSVKMLLINDLEKAGSTISEDSRTIHYFLHQSGKRRLKAENSDFPEGEINIEKEKASMDLDLPAYVYIIHDFTSQTECYIYVKKPSDLKTLSNISLYDAVNKIKTDKYLLRRNSRIDIGKKNDVWEVNNKFRKGNDQIEISPNFGFGLLGSRWAPVAGLELALKFADKYGVQKYKFGGSVSAYTFTEFQEKELKDLNTVISYDLKFLFNLNYQNSGKSKWFGIEGGYLTENNKGPLNNTYKTGITGEGFGAFNVSFDIFFPYPKKAFYGITLRMPF